MLGQEVSGSALSRLTVEDGSVVVTAESVDVGNDVADDLLGRALDGRFDVRVPLRGLPYGLQVDVGDGAARRTGRPRRRHRHRAVGAPVLTRQTASGAGATLVPMQPSVVAALVKRRAVDFCRTGSCLCPAR